MIKRNLEFNLRIKQQLELLEDKRESIKQRIADLHNILNRVQDQTTLEVVTRNSQMSFLDLYEVNQMILYFRNSL